MDKDLPVDEGSSGCSLSAVLGFLKSRDVSQDVLDSFASEKMDCMGALHSPTSLLSDLGLEAKGDIFALKAFCERRLGKCSVETPGQGDLEEKKKKLIEQLRNEKNKKKRKRGSSQTTPQPEPDSTPKKVPKKEKPKSRRITIGWLHYSYKDSRFVAVRMARGGGARRIDIHASATKEDVIQRAKKLFFPEGQSCHGPAHDMKFDLANFKLENISKLVDEQGNRQPFTVQRYFEVHKLTQARIYLTSKKLSTVSSSNEDTEVVLIGSQQQQDRGKPWRQKYAKEDKEMQLRQELDDVKRLEVLRKARESRVPPEPATDSQRLIVSVKHCLEGDVSRFFDPREKMIAVYDWVGSLNLFPEHFNLCLRPGKRLEPSECITVLNGSPLHMEITVQPVPMSPSETDITFKGFGLGECASPIDIDLTAPLMPIQDLDLLTDSFSLSPTGAIMLGDARSSDETQEHEQSSVFDAGAIAASERRSSGDIQEGPQLAEDNISTSAFTSRVITIRRANVRQDMLDIFQDPCIMNCHIIVEMLNERGIAEKGKGSGVFKDALSLFWKDIYDSLMLGEGERVPFIRHDFQRHQWEALARILVKGFQVYQYFPVRLSKPFIVACLFGESAVSDEMLISSFMQYVSNDERTVVQECVNGEVEIDDAQLIDLLSNFECKRVIQKSTLRQTVIEMAHKELIQRPQYVADCWKDIVTSLADSFPTVESLLYLYDHLAPTTTKLLNTIDCEANTQEERDSLKFFKRYLKGLDSRMVSTFMRFFSGSDLMLFDSWQVTFTDVRGYARRPIAHTCTNMLELPSTYQSFPELREEFNNVLKSEDWEMDIV